MKREHAIMKTALSAHFAATHRAADPQVRSAGKRLAICTEALGTSEHSTNTN